MCGIVGLIKKDKINNKHIKLINRSFKKIYYIVDQMKRVGTLGKILF